MRRKRAGAGIIVELEHGPLRERCGTLKRYAALERRFQSRPYAFNARKTPISRKMPPTAGSTTGKLGTAFAFDPRQLHGEDHADQADHQRQPSEQGDEHRPAAHPAVVEIDDGEF